MKSNFNIVSDSTIQKKSNLFQKGDIVSLKDMIGAFRIIGIYDNGAKITYYMSNEITGQYAERYEHEIDKILERDVFCNIVGKKSIVRNLKMKNGKYQIKEKTFYNQKQGYYINIETAKYSNLSIGKIADILNISCQEVCSQFNRMIKESNYKLFN